MKKCYDGNDTMYECMCISMCIRICIWVEKQCKRLHEKFVDENVDNREHEFNFLSYIFDYILFYKNYFDINISYSTKFIS